MELLTKIALGGATLLSLACFLISQRRFFKGLSDAYLRLTHLQRVLVLVAVAICTVYAQKPNTNDVGGVSGTNGVAGVSGTNEVNGTDGELPPPLTMLPLGGLAGDDGIQIVPADVASGYRLESMTTNPAISYAMPSGASVVGTWNLRGAYEDVVKTDLGDFLFPIGRHLCDSLWVYTWGFARPQLKNTSNELVAVGNPMSAIPGASCFWTAATTNDTRLLTWENFAVGRVPVSGDVSSYVSGQIELFRSGDYIARSNDVESVYRRVNPDDWDDDGIPNEDDDEPLLGGDSDFGPHQEIPEGDDVNHYCWVDIVVRQANARVDFVGEGDSWLPDPSFIAKAGATNRVILLIGKTYAVHCDMPLACVGKSDAEIETWVDGGLLMINWPVWFEYVSTVPLLMMASPLFGAGPSGGGTTIRVYPERMGGGNYSWPDNFCCYSFAADGTPAFDCKGSCGCGGGCYTGEVAYECSGHSFSFGGWYCGCHEHPDDDSEVPHDGPAATASFSSKAIVFEDTYTNAPGQVVGWQSTSSEVTCYAYGGTNGISYSFTIEGADGKLMRTGGARFPLTGTLGAGKTFMRRITYKAVAPSTNAEDIVVKSEYTENGTGTTKSEEEKVTAVKVYVDAKATSPSNRRRHVFGPNESYEVLTEPGGYGKETTVTPLEQGDFDVALTVEKVNYSIGLTVIYPLSEVHGQFVREMTAADWTSIGKDPLGEDVPGAGFVARWYLQPDYVSFSGIQVCEGEVPMSEVWGCFTNASDYPPAVYAHIPGSGSGEPTSIGEGNLIGDGDRIGVQLGVPPTSAGGYSLVIPWSWGIMGGPYSHAFTYKRQSVSVTADGFTTIRKGELFTIRGVNE